MLYKGSEEKLNMVKFKKYLLSLTLAFSILGWMCPDLQVSAAPAGHVHEWGSYEWFESVVSVHVYDMYDFYKDGHHYMTQEVVEIHRYYRECYCGERISKPRRITYYRDVMIN